MEPVEEPVQQIIKQETAALERERHGDVAITVGKVLLWVDLILVCFVEVGLRTDHRPRFVLFRRRARHGCKSHAHREAHHGHAGVLPRWGEC